MPSRVFDTYRPWAFPRLWRISQGTLSRSQAGLTTPRRVLVRVITLVTPKNQALLFIPSLIFSPLFPFSVLTTTPSTHPTCENIQWHADEAVLSVGGQALLLCDGRVQRAIRLQRRRPSQSQTVLEGSHPYSGRDCGKACRGPLRGTPVDPLWVSEAGLGYEWEVRTCVSVRVIELCIVSVMFRVPRKFTSTMSLSLLFSLPLYAFLPLSLEMRKVRHEDMGGGRAEQVWCNDASSSRSSKPTTTTATRER